MTKQWANWSGAVTAAPQVICAPSSETELSAVVKQSPGAVRVAGSGHSFTPLCETSGTLLSLDALQGLVSVDASQRTATVKAGTKVYNIGRPLFDAGFGLMNQGDIDRQAIAGALSTGTHGTGISLGSLSSEIAAFRLVTATGDAIECSPTSHPEIWEAGRVSLGTFGVLSEVTLRVRPAYRLKERNWVMGVDECWTKINALRDGHRHFEFFWFPLADSVVAKSLDETDEDVPPPGSSEKMKERGERVSSDQRLFLYGCELARIFPGLSGPLQRLFTRGAMGAATRARWSHEIFPSPRTTRFNEMEYAVPAANGVDCIQEIGALIRSRKIAGVFPIEFRFVKGDDIWLSPFYKRDAVTISVHQFFKQSYAPLFDAVETIFKRYGGRPHWGKIHAMQAAELERAYPKWGAFKDLRRRLDPDAKFLNTYLRTMLGEGHGKAA